MFLFSTPKRATAASLREKTTDVLTMFHTAQERLVGVLQEQKELSNQLNEEITSLSAEKAAVDKEAVYAEKMINKIQTFLN